MIEIATTSGSQAVIDEADFDELRMRMRGPLLRVGHAGYDEARVVFNGMFDRRPALIVRCHGVADVLDAVQFARRHHLLTAVRGGGHSVSGNSMCDEGLVIDLSPMNSVSRGSQTAPSPASRVARRGPTSIAKRRPSASRRPGASCRIRAWPA